MSAKKTETKTSAKEVETLKETEDKLVVRARKPLKEKEFKLLSDLIKHEEKKTGLKIVLIPASSELVEEE